MRKLVVFTSLLSFAGPQPTADPLAASAQQKLDLIQSGKAKPGSTVLFTTSELNAWARGRLPGVVPEGVRNARVQLGNGAAMATMQVDLLKVRHGQGIETNWFVSKLIQGERPLKVVAHIESANGKATVRLVLVELSGVPVMGSTLDFLIENFFKPLYPDARINEPFELNEHIDHIEVHPGEARAVMKR